MNRFYYLFLVIFIVVILPVRGSSVSNKNIDSTEELTQNDKSLIASLINLSFLLNREQLSAKRINKLKIEDKELIDYIDKFSDKIKNISQSEKVSYLIEKIKEDDNSFNDYINDFKKIILNDGGKLDGVYGKWDSFSGNGISFILFPKDKTEKYGVFIYKKDSENGKLFAKELEQYTEFISVLPVKEDDFQKSPILKNIIFAKKIFSNRKINNMFIYPPIDDKTDYMQKGVIVYENGLRFKDYERLGKKYLNEYKNSMINQKVILRLRLYHIIFHSVGPFFIKDKESITIDKPLKELFLSIEEIKAEIMSYLFIDYLIKQEDIFKKYYSNIEPNFIIYLSDRKDRRGSIASDFILNYLLDKGGIKEEGGKKIINKSKFTPLLYLLLKKIINIESEGDYNKAKEILIKYKKPTFWGKND